MTAEERRLDKWIAEERGRDWARHGGQDKGFEQKPLNRNTRRKKSLLILNQKKSNVVEKVSSLVRHVFYHASSDEINPIAL